MKIAIVHNLLSGGAKRALHEFCKGLRQQGHTLDVYLPSLANEEFLPLAPYVDRVIRFPLESFKLWQTRGLPFVLQYLNLPRRMLYLQRLKKVYAVMAREIDCRNYDVVFVHHCQVVQSPYILRFLRTPSVYYCQEPPRRLYEPEIPRKRPVTVEQKIRKVWYAPANVLYRYKVKRDDAMNARSASLILANSYFSKESIYRAYGVNARVNYLGVDTKIFVPPSDAIPKEQFVLAVGRTFPEKGYDFLLQALEKIPVSMRPKLVIVADMRDSDEERYLSFLAEQYDLEFEIYSDIPDEELIRWYHRAKLFVYASVMEPFGFAPLEAMSCGLTVVAVKEGGVRETVLDGESGCLTQRDPKEFSEKMMTLLNNPSRCRKFCDKAHEYVTTSWTWEKSVAELQKNFFTASSQGENSQGSPWHH